MDEIYQNETQSNQDDIQYNINSLQDFDPESNNLSSTDNPTINIDKNFQSVQHQQSIKTPKIKVSFKSSIKQSSTTEPINLKHGILQSNNIDIPYLYVPTGGRPSNDNDDDNCNVWDAIFQTEIINRYCAKPEFIFYLDECPDDLYNPQSAYRLYKANEVKKKPVSVDVETWRMQASKDRNNLLQSKLIDPKNNEDKAINILISKTMKSRLRTIIQSISKAFVEKGAFYIINHHPFKPDKLIDIVNRTLPPTGILLPVFCVKELKDYIDDFTTDSFLTHAVHLDEDIDRTVECNYSLVNSIKNMIIFQSLDDKKYFMTEIEKKISCGRFCISDNKNVLKNSIHSVKCGLPLVIFRYTGTINEIMSQLIESKCQKNNNVVKDNTKTLLSTLYAWKLTGIASSKNKNTKVHEDDNDNDDDDDDNDNNKENLIDSLRFDWPEHFNPENVIIIDTLDDRPSDIVIKIMNAIENDNMRSNEGFSEKYERDAHDRIHNVFLNISHQLYHTELWDSFVFYSIEILQFLVVWVSLVIDYLIFQSNTNSQTIQYLRILNIMLPIILSSFVAINNGFNLTTKVAILRLTAERIASELYRYKCRVSEYNNANKLTAITPRKLFTAKIDSILDTSMGDADLTSFYLKPKCGIQDMYKFDYSMTYTAEEYINERIIAIYTNMNTYAPRYRKILQLYQILLILLTSLCSLLSAFNYQLWIPAVISLTVAMKGYMKHYKIELISNLFNLTCQKINHLMLEWEGKCLQERLDQTAKNNLVDRVEGIIISAHEVIYQAITTPTTEDVQQPMLDSSKKTVDNNNKA